MRLTRLLYMTFLGALAAGALILGVSLVEANTTAPKTKFNFTPLSSTSVYRVDIDKSTKHSIIDAQGDTLVGAVIRLTPTTPIAGIVDGQLIGTFINTVVAVCGNGGMILAQTTFFDPTGKPLGTASPMEVIRVEPSRNPTADIYEYLCQGNTTRKGYNSTWI